MVGINVLKSKFELNFKMMSDKSTDCHYRAHLGLKILQIDLILRIQVNLDLDKLWATPLLTEGCIHKLRFKLLRKELRGFSYLLLQDVSHI